MNESNESILHLIILHCILQLAEKHVAPWKTILTSTELFFILSFQIGSYELTVYIIWNNILAQKKYCIKLNNNLSYESILNHALEVLINEKLHSTKLELCINYDPPQYVSEFRVVENLWQWPWLEISLDVIQQSTILDKQFKINLSIHHFTTNRFVRTTIIWWTKYEFV